MEILVTGGAGYIGSHLIQELNNLGAKCFVIDNLSRGLVERILPEVTFDNVDLTDSRTVKKYLSGRKFDAIFHLAGLMQARESTRLPEEYWRHNTIGTENLVREYDYELDTKFVFSSSCSVYGNNVMATENSSLDPLSIYAKSKLEAEKFLKDHYLDGKKLTIFRFFNVVGASSTPFYCDIQQETLLPSTARRIIQGEKPVIFGNSFQTHDGSAIRDFVDVRDLVKAMVIPLTCNISGIHNIASNKATTILEAVKELMKVANVAEMGVEVISNNPEDPGIIGAKTSNVLLDLAWNPQFSLSESIKSFWDTFRDYYFKKEKIYYH